MSTNSTKRAASPMGEKGGPKKKKKKKVKKLNLPLSWILVLDKHVKKLVAIVGRREKLESVVEKLDGNTSMSARLFLDQVEKAKEDEDIRYLDLIAKVVEDNGDRYLQMILNKSGYIYINALTPESGSILKKMNQTTPLFHLVLLNYRYGKVLPFDTNGGGMTGDHLKDKMSNNPYTQLRLLAKELNSFRKSEKKPEFKQGQRFGLPLHQMIFDRKKKKFKKPFNATMMRRTAAGRYLVDSCHYYEGAGKDSSRTWATTAAAAERRFDRIVKNVCALLIDAIDGEGGDAFCEAMGLGWSNPIARANNLALLRKRKRSRA